MTEKGIFK